MFEPDQRVWVTRTGEPGHVVGIDFPFIDVKFDDERVERFNSAMLDAMPAESAPGPSADGDPVHAAMLRHARNAGAAVTALEIIRREAKTALVADCVESNAPLVSALRFVEKFADDVLSHVLPA